MPTRRYPLNRGEEKRLEIEYPRSLSELSIRFDSRTVGIVHTKQELRAGKRFPLSDGSTVEVKLARVAGRGLPRRVVVLRNGWPVPGSPSDPDLKVRAAFRELFTAGDLALAAGLLAPLVGASAGMFELIFGALCVALSYFVLRRSTVALGLAVGLAILAIGLAALAIDLKGLNFILNLQALFNAGSFISYIYFVALFGPVAILESSWPGFRAIRELQAETQGGVVQAGVPQHESQQEEAGQRREEAALQQEILAAAAPGTPSSLAPLAPSSVSSAQRKRPLFIRKTVIISVIVLLVTGVVSGLIYLGTSPAIVSFTVDHSNVSVGTTVHFTVQLNKPISSSSSYALAYITDSGCNQAVGDCISLPIVCFDSTTCTFTDSLDSPQTVEYGVFLQDTSRTDQQTGNPPTPDEVVLTLFVTWS